MSELRRTIVGRPDKRSEVVDAAQRVFGRTGYALASMDLVAKEASVSTRTIYKHFPTKEDLFATVLEASAARVANDFIREVRDAPLTDPPQTLLTRLGHAYLRHLDDHPEHFAMVQQIKAGALDLPDVAIERWHLAGPERILDHITETLKTLIDAGSLRARSSSLAALHFVALVLAPRVVHPYGGSPFELTASDTVDSAVATFLRGYGAPENSPLQASRG